MRLVQRTGGRAPARTQTSGHSPHPSGRVFRVPRGSHTPPDPPHKPGVPSVPPNSKRQTAQTPGPPPWSCPSKLSFRGPPQSQSFPLGWGNGGFHLWDISVSAFRALLPILGSPLPPPCPERQETLESETQLGKLPCGDRGSLSLWGESRDTPTPPQNFSGSRLWGMRTLRF